MLRGTPLTLSSKVGGYLRFIKGTCKKGRGAIHTRSIMGKRGRMKQWSKTHGLRDGTPDSHNQVTGSLGVKFGAGGLFGARKAQGARLKLLTHDAMEAELYGHPHITNTYMGQLDAHPALEAVVAEAPIDLTVVVAMPKFTVNKNLISCHSSNGTPSPSPIHPRQLPSAWKASTEAMADLCRRTLGTPTSTAAGGGSCPTAPLVLATSKASVLIARTNPTTNSSAAEGCYTVTVRAAAGNNEDAAAKATAAEPSRTATHAVTTAMCLLLQEHIIATHHHQSMGETMTVVRKDSAKGTVVSKTTVSSAAAATSACSSAKAAVGGGAPAIGRAKPSPAAAPPTSLTDRKRTSLFGANTKQGSTLSPRTPTTNPAIRTPAAIIAEKELAAQHLKQQAGSASNGIHDVLQTLSNGLPLTTANIRSSATPSAAAAAAVNTTAGADIPALMISSCLRVDPHWEDALTVDGETELMAELAKKPSSSSTTDTNKSEVTMKTSKRSLSPAASAAISEAYALAKQRADPTTASSSLTLDKATTTNTTNADEPNATPIVRPDVYSEVRSASLAATSIQSLGARRTSFVTLSSSLPIAALCQWAYYNDDKRVPLTATARVEGELAREAYIGSMAASMQQADPYLSFVGSTNGRHYTLVGGDDADDGRPKVAETRGTWVDPIGRSNNPLATSIYEERAAAEAAIRTRHQRQQEALVKRLLRGGEEDAKNATTGESACLSLTEQQQQQRRLKVVMLVRCFTLQRNKALDDPTLLRSAVSEGEVSGSNAASAGAAALASSQTYRLGEDTETEEGANAKGGGKKKRKTPLTPADRLAEAVKAQLISSEWAVGEMLSSLRTGGSGASSSSDTPQQRKVGMRGILDSIHEQQQSAMMMNGVLSRPFTLQEVVAGSPLAAAAASNPKESSSHQRKALLIPTASFLNNKRMLRQQIRASADKATRKALKEQLLAGSDATTNNTTTNTKLMKTTTQGRSGADRSPHQPLIPCPIVDYINDEVRNPTTALLKKRYGLRPVVEECFGALEALRQWHVGVSRGKHHRHESYEAHHRHAARASNEAAANDVAVHA